MTPEGVLGLAEVRPGVQRHARVLLGFIQVAVVGAALAEVEVHERDQVVGVGVVVVELDGLERVVQRLARLALPEPQIARQVVLARRSCARGRRRAGCPGSADTPRAVEAGSPA